MGMGAIGRAASPAGTNGRGGGVEGVSHWRGYMVGTPAQGSGGDPPLIVHSGTVRARVARIWRSSEWVPPTQIGPETQKWLRGYEAKNRTIQGFRFRILEKFAVLLVSVGLCRALPIRELDAETSVQ